MSSFRYRRHYSLDEARALLPEIRTWLDEIRLLRDRMAEADQRLGQLVNRGDDVGGPSANQWIRIVVGLQAKLREFERREIQIKDLDRGLVDFPAVIGGREVFLCWEQDDEDIEFWHDLDAGYAGRERL